MSDYTVSFETNSDKIMTVLEALTEYAIRRDEDGDTNEAQLAWAMYSKISQASKQGLRRDGWYS